MSARGERILAETEDCARSPAREKERIRQRREGVNAEALGYLLIFLLSWSGQLHNRLSCGDGIPIV